VLAAAREDGVCARVPDEEGACVWGGGFDEVVLFSGYGLCVVQRSVRLYISGTSSSNKVHGDIT
jgi:hypothetical protein